MTQEYERTPETEDAGRRPAPQMETDREAAPAPTDRTTARERSPRDEVRDEVREDPRQEMAPERSGREAGAADNSGMAEYRARFEQIQAKFIEEPRGAVRSAQTLVEEAVTRMMHGLQQADGADTEQLRVAMKRYRDLLYQVTETA